MSSPQSILSREQISANVVAVIENYCGVAPLNSSAPLRETIVHSLTFLQVIMDIEECCKRSLDYSSFDVNTSLDELIDKVVSAKAINSPESQSSPETLRAQKFPSAKDEESEGVQKPKRTDSKQTLEEEIPLNPIQIAYLMGDDPDLELGGQATLIYLETHHSQPFSEVYKAVSDVLSRHNIFRYRPDIMTGTLQPDPSFGPKITTDQDVPDLDRESMIAEGSKAHHSKHLVHAHVVAELDGGTRVQWVFAMVVVDAGSLYFILDELAERLAGHNLPTPPRAKDAACRLATRWSSEDRAVARTYWRNVAHHLPQCPEFPVCVIGDHPWRTKRLSTLFSPDTVAVAEQRAKQYGTTLNALILALHTSALCRWLSVPDVTFNVTVTDRPFAGDEQGAGVNDYTSSILVGAFPSRTQSLEECAEQIDHAMTEGLRYRAMSGVEVLQEFFKESRSDGKATAPFVFTSYLGANGGAGQSVPNPFDIDNIYTHTSQVCLDIQLMPSDKGLLLSWDYVPEYWPYINAMFSCVTDAFHAVINGDETWPVVDEQTNKKIQDFNNTGPSPWEGRTLIDLVRENREAHPDALAIRDIDETMSYQQLWDNAGKVATYLQREGCSKGDLVAVEYSRRSADIVAMVGVLRAGAAWVPIDSQLPDRRKETILRRSNAVTVLRSSVEEIWQSFPENPKEVVLDPDDLAYVIFTSGTTGEPKGVEITHRGVVGTIGDISERFEVNQKDRLIALSSYGFDLSVYDIFGAFATGASVFLVRDERDADEIIEVLRNDETTIWNTAPALLELLFLRIAENTVFPDMRVVMLSGDRIPATLVARTRDVFPNARIISLGGATEASIWSICIEVDENSFDGAIPYGYPLRGQRVHVLGPDRRPCPLGVPGDIWISGNGIARGYIGDPKRTAAAFVELPNIGRSYDTGDRGVMGDNGYIEFLGRRDRQVKVAGHRIELGEIEATATQVAGVTRAVAGVFSTRQDTPALYCVVVQSATGNGETLADAVRNRLRQSLPTYMVPTVIEVRTELPVTSNGKVDYRRLEQQVKEGQVSNRDVVLGATSNHDEPIPEILREIWTDSLGGVTESESLGFFEAGGDSLGFQRMLRKVEERTGIRPRFRDIIVDPTLPTLAKVVVKGIKLPNQRIDEHREDLNEIGPNDPFPLTEMQQAYLIGRRAGFQYSGMGEHYYLESVTDVDLVRLEAALNKVIRAHPMLRAVIVGDDQQRVLADVDYYNIPVMDLRHATEDEIEEQISRHRARLSHEVFDPEQWPLFRLEALLLPDEHVRLFFSIDLMIGDGASQQIFIEDLGRAYRGEPLVEQNGTFQEYAIELQKRNLATTPQQLLGSEEYNKVISTFPAGSTLVLSEPVDEDPAMERLSRRFNASEVHRLQVTAAQLGCSLSALFLAAYAAALTSFSRGNRVGLNITTYNRDPEIGAHHNVIGDFTGVVLLPFENADIADLADTAREAQNALLTHLTAHYPGTQVLAEIARQKKSFGSAVAPFVFTSLLFDSDVSSALPHSSESIIKSTSSGGFSADRRIESDRNVLGTVEWVVSQTPQVLIDNQVIAVGNEISLAWDYRSGALDRQLVEDVFDVYCRTIDSCITGQPDVARLEKKQASRLRCLLSGSASNTSGASNKDPVAGQPSATALRRVSEALQSFGISCDSIDDNLFEHGIDSLSFVSLVQRIEEIAGHDIALADALETPTQRGLAALVHETDLLQPHRRCLSLLRKGDPTKVLLFVHGGFGTVDIYQQLARSMPGNYEIWGLSFAEHFMVYPQYLSIEELAADYVAAIRGRISPDSSIAVAGWSVGGTLAVELAHQLGDRCQALVLLDSLAPGPIVDVGDFTEHSERKLLESIPGFGISAEKSISDGVEGLWIEAQCAIESAHNSGAIRELARSLSPTLLEDLGMSGDRVTLTDLNTLRTLVAARNAYQPRSYRYDEALLVLPDDGEAENSRNWSKYGVKSVRSAEVIGNHYSFVMEQQGSATAQIIASYIEGRGM